jgi:hypothetical protein
MPAHFFFGGGRWECHKGQDCDVVGKRSQICLKEGGAAFSE